MECCDGMLSLENYSQVRTMLLCSESYVGGFLGGVDPYIPGRLDLFDSEIFSKVVEYEFSGNAY